MRVRVRTAKDEKIWYADCIGQEFDVFSLKDEFFYIPIPFEYLTQYLPFMLLYRVDCEVLDE